MAGPHRDDLAEALDRLGVFGGMDFTIAVERGNFSAAGALVSASLDGNDPEAAASGSQPVYTQAK